MADPDEAVGRVPVVTHRAGAEMASPSTTTRPLRDSDYESLFSGVPTPVAVLDTQFVIHDCTNAYLEVVHRPRERLVGRSLFEAFPRSESAAGNDLEELEQALTNVVATRQSVVLSTVRYDLREPGTAGPPRPRYWAVTAVPVLDDSGAVSWILYNVHDVTAIHSHLNHDDSVVRQLPPASEAIKVAASVAEQSRLFDTDLEVERQFGMTVQRLMLPTGLPEGVRGRGGLAVRYRPASDALTVGGDWYDVADLGDGRLALAVGDVVGHGLVAASVMGQLRSALSALIVADIGPANAIAALDRVSRASPEASASTAVKVVIDPMLDLATYSSAGHLPPVLVRRDGAVHLLDHAQGPPLAVTDKVEQRPLGTATVSTGDVLVLYTDGLVERRDEDIDVSIARLAELVSRHRDLEVEDLADLLLAELTQPFDLRDDVALVVVRV